MPRRLLYNFIIALDSIGQNKLRGFLTSLGIIFGVASVIAMLAIGRGAQEEILEQMTLLGANNLIITPVIEQEEGEVEAEDDPKAEKARFSPGLSLLDAQSLADLPFIEAASPEVVVETIAIRAGRKRSTKLVGIGSAYQYDTGFELAEGTFFNAAQIETARPVCIIGHHIRTRFFPTDEPVGKQIKCGRLWLTIVGVMKPRSVSRETRNELSRIGIRNYDMDIYVPIKTALLRYQNRGLVTKSSIRKSLMEDNDNEEESVAKPAFNYHQLDKIVLRIEDTEKMRKLAEITSRMLTRRHYKVVDFEVIIPELLLEQKQRTTAMFNIVLGAIASISLIVGGIGIMNIMLASVLERINEIGLRLALGATKKDIVMQFLCEAITISITGGLIGILLGLSFSFAIRGLAGIQTIVSVWSVLLSFFVAVTVGIIFGIYPARRAAQQDPVVSLRAN